MLDKRSKSALRFFVDECSEGSYKIVETEDIIKHLPKNLKVDADAVAQIIKYLENGEYISVKYADADQYCLCPLPFGRQFIENIDQEENHKKQNRFFALKNGLTTFIGSLLGAFIGTLIYYML
ncbi:MAG: hypothetical protein IKV69_00700 [Clostridia bacterium]|nr:hypothetical protein [Clostridia bacterium]